MSNFDVVYKVINGQPVPFIIQKPEQEPKQAKAVTPNKPEKEEVNAVIETKPKKKGVKKNV